MDFTIWPFLLLHFVPSEIRNSLRFLAYVAFLAHLRWKSKSTFVMSCLPSTVRPSVCPSIYKLFTFKIFIFSRTTVPISNKLGTQHSFLKGFKFVQIKDRAVFQADFFFKIFLSRINGPILTKICTKRPWVKRIQICLNEGSVFSR